MKRLYHLFLIFLTSWFLSTVYANPASQSNLLDEPVSCGTMISEFNAVQAALLGRRKGICTTSEPTCNNTGRNLIEYDAGLARLLLLKTLQEMQQKLASTTSAVAANPFIADFTPPKEQARQILSLTSAVNDKDLMLGLRNALNGVNEATIDYQNFGTNHRSANLEVNSAIQTACRKFNKEILGRDKDVKSDFDIEKNYKKSEGNQLPLYCHEKYRETLVQFTQTALKSDVTNYQISTPENEDAAFLAKLAYYQSYMKEDHVAGIHRILNQGPSEALKKRATLRDLASELSGGPLKGNFSNEDDGLGPELLALKESILSSGYLRSASGTDNKARIIDATLLVMGKQHESLLDSMEQRRQSMNYYRDFLLLKKEGLDPGTPAYKEVEYSLKTIELNNNRVDAIADSGSLEQQIVKYLNGKTGCSTEELEQITVESFGTLDTDNCFGSIESEIAALESNLQNRTKQINQDREENGFHDVASVMGTIMLAKCNQSYGVKKAPLTQVENCAVSVGVNIPQAEKLMTTTGEVLSSNFNHLDDQKLKESIGVARKLCSNNSVYLGEIAPRFCERLTEIAGNVTPFAEDTFKENVFEHFLNDANYEEASESDVTPQQRGGVHPNALAHKLNIEQLEKQNEQQRVERNRKDIEAHLANRDRFHQRVKSESTWKEEENPYEMPMIAGALLGTFDTATQLITPCSLIDCSPSNFAFDNGERAARYGIFGPNFQTEDPFAMYASQNDMSQGRLFWSSPNFGGQNVNYNGPFGYRQDMNRYLDYGNFNQIYPNFDESQLQTRDFRST